MAYRGIAMNMKVVALIWVEDRICIVETMNMKRVKAHDHER